jgi:DNA recombination protein RmuC
MIHHRRRPILSMTALTLAVAIGVALLVGMGIAALVAHLLAKGPKKLIARLEGELDRTRTAIHDLTSRGEAAALNATRHEGTATALATDVARLEAVVARMEGDAHEQGLRIESLVRREQDLAGQVDAFQKNEQRLVSECEALQSQASTALQQVATLGASLAKASAELTAEREAHTVTRRFIEDASTQLRSSFIEAASKVFDEKAIALDEKIRLSGETAKVGVESTIKPFAESMATFQQRIEQITKDSALERSQLVGSIGELKTLNQNMAQAADGLTKALKGNSKARGDWGELLLETVLKSSGLEEGTNYLRQEHTRDDEGRGVRPDVIVLLPDGRKVVVDSKVSLVAWTDMVNATTPKEQEEALLRHTASLRGHVRDLASKNYPKAVGPDALELTVMFVPVEGALSAALGVNDDLQMEAFSKNIVFTSPNTLMALLRVVERHWVRDRLQRQVNLVADAATKLLDSVIAFVDDFDQIGERLQKVDACVRKASNRLRESPQSVIARTRRLIDAGAKASKALPDELQFDAASPPLLVSDGVPALVE